MRTLTRLLIAILTAAILSGCASTYLVHMNNGEKMYVESPIVITKDKKYYIFSVNGRRKVVDFDDVFYVDRAAEVCYENEKDKSSICFESFYYE